MMTKMQRPDASPNRIDHLLKPVDKVFLVYLARKRRKSRNKSSDNVWDAATYLFSLYLCAPIAALTVLLGAVVSFFSDLEFSRSDLKGWAYPVAIAFGAFIWWQNNRYKKYLVNPPELRLDETREEARLLLKFRLLTIGLPVAAITAGYFAFHRN